jgi:YD repeat-containing protein
VWQLQDAAEDNWITTHYSYDVAGNLRVVTDPNESVTLFDVNDFGETFQEVSDATAGKYYRYDSAGNQTSSALDNGTQTTRTFDALNRVLTATSTSSEAETEVVTSTYDGSAPFGLGRLSTLTDPTGSTTYTYDRSGLLLKEVRTIQGMNVTSKYRYDLDANRTTIVYPSGLNATYSYDSFHRPRTLAAGYGSSSTPIITMY